MPYDASSRLSNAGARRAIYSFFPPNASHRTDLIKITTMFLERSLCWVLAVYILLTLTTDAQEPSSEGEAPTCAQEKCGVYDLAGWMLAGKNYRRGDVLMEHIAIPWFQHSRRAWPRWNRHESMLLQSDKGPYHYWFVGTKPLDCHERLSNVRVAIEGESAKFIVLQPIQKGDPIFLECRPEMKDSADKTPAENFPRIDSSLLETLPCVNPLQVKESKIHGRGVFSRESFTKDQVIAVSEVIHIHRTELINATSGEPEKLINHCIGNSKTDLLLLPTLSGLTALNHGDESNIRLVVESHRENGDDFTPFQESTEQWFALKEFASGLEIQMIAIRDINQGDELIVDYGTEWKEAFAKAAKDPKKPFRAPLTPDDFYPDDWLAKETLMDLQNMPEFDYKKLGGGEVAPVSLIDGRVLHDYVLRVGFPDGFVDKMQQWAEEMGILEMLQKYVTERPLEVHGEERFKVNGGRWWTRRFDSYWYSNMHYVTPDDDEANEQYYHALHEAGFDQVLQGVGDYLGVDKLSCYYPSFIVVTHCVNTFMHSDSEFDPVANLIWPLVQVNTSDPELILGASDDSNDLHVPYRYEREAGILVGHGGMHGTAPTDYRGTDGLRIVASVYMGDLSKFSEPEWNEFVDLWVDPPYPKYKQGQLHHALHNRIHWDRNDPTASLISPMAKFHPSS